MTGTPLASAPRWRSRASFSGEGPTSRDAASSIDWRKRWKRSAKAATSGSTRWELIVGVRCLPDTHESALAACRDPIGSICPMARVFSGVQPTGEEPHIGNYIGAFRRWVDLQETQDECFYCVVDLHAMTMPWKPDVLAEGVRRTAATLIATGIDPERSVLFVQSEVAEHTELGWILTCLARMGELGRMTQFKDKSRGDLSESV